MTINYAKAIRGAVPEEAHPPRLHHSDLREPVERREARPEDQERTGFPALTQVKSIELTEISNTSLHFYIINDEKSRKLGLNYLRALT